MQREIQTHTETHTGTQAHTRTYGNRHKYTHRRALTQKPRKPACIQGMTNQTCYSGYPGLTLMRGHFQLSRKDEA
jgi:hypothetical protein